MTVKFMLPKPSASSHACLAQLFFSTNSSHRHLHLASWRRGPEIVEDSGWPSLRSLPWPPPFRVVQLALGADTGTRFTVSAAYLRSHLRHRVPHYK